MNMKENVRNQKSAIIAGMQRRIEVWRKQVYNKSIIIC